jgi:hypothetical protein
MPSLGPSHRRGRAREAAVRDLELRAISAMLARRGLDFVEANPRDRLAFPDDLKAGAEDAFYQEMKRYSSRILLRDLIHHGARRLSDLTRFAASAAAAEFLERMRELGVVEHDRDDTWRLRRWGQARPGEHPLHSFGDTLEWFVAQIFRREMAVPAAWGVVVRGNAVGGDLDVVAALEEHFVVAEVKASPPKHVDLDAVRAFVQRVSTLRPHAAFFVEDTELRMADKIVPLFADALAERRGRRDVPIRRLEHELFLVGQGVYIVNSRADLTANLRTCIAHFLRERGIGDLG